MSQDDQGAPKGPPRPTTSVVSTPAGSAPVPSAPAKKPPPPVPPRSAPRPDELDDVDLLSDERDVVAPSPDAPASSFEGIATVSSPEPSAPNPFLPADAQPRDQRPIRRTATDSTESAPLREPEAVVPGAEPAPRESPPGSRSPPSVPRKRSRASVLALLLVPIVTVGGVFVYRVRSADEQRRAASFSEIRARDAEPADPPLPSNYVEPPPPPTQSSPSPEKSAAARGSAKSAAGRAPAVAASVPPGESGILDTTHLPAGRKIVVNGRVIGFSPRRVPVRCGTLRVQIGDLPTERIDLPCGGEVTFTDE